MELPAVTAFPLHDPTLDLVLNEQFPDSSDNTNRNLSSSVGSQSSAISESSVWHPARVFLPSLEPSLDAYPESSVPHEDFFFGEEDDQQDVQLNGDLVSLSGGEGGITNSKKSHSTDLEASLTAELDEISDDNDDDDDDEDDESYRMAAFSDGDESDSDSDDMEPLLEPYGLTANVFAEVTARSRSRSSTATLRAVSATSLLDAPARAQLRNVLRELLGTEDVYVADLSRILDHYAIPLATRSRQATSGISTTDVSEVFGNIGQIAEMHRLIFQDTCAEARKELHIDSGSESLAPVSDAVMLSAVSGICDVFGAAFRRGGTSYASYIRNSPISNAAISRLSSLESFREFCKVARRRSDDKLDLHDLLIKPMQRITKYPLLFRELQKLLPTPTADALALAVAIDSEESSTLVIKDPLDIAAASATACVNSAREIAKYVNKLKGHSENSQKMKMLQRMFGSSWQDCDMPGRKFIREGVVQKASPSGPTSHERHLILFNDILVYAKRRVLTKKEVRKASSFLLGDDDEPSDVFSQESSGSLFTSAVPGEVPRISLSLKGSIPLSVCSVKHGGTRNRRIFRVSRTDSKRQYVFTCPTDYERTAWATSIAARCKKARDSHVTFSHPAATKQFKRLTAENSARLRTVSLETAEPRSVESRSAQSVPLHNDRLMREAMSSALSRIAGLEEENMGLKAQISHLYDGIADLEIRLQEQQDQVVERVRMETAKVLTSFSGLQAQILAAIDPAGAFSEPSAQRLIFQSPRSSTTDTLVGEPTSRSPKNEKILATSTAETTEVSAGDDIQVVTRLHDKPDVQRRPTLAIGPARASDSTEENNVFFLSPPNADLSEPPRKTGWLQKQGEGKRSGFKKRFTVLTSNALAYSEVEGQTSRPNGVVPISRGATARIHESRKHGFVVFCPQKRREFQFTASSDRERDEWLEAILTSIADLSDSYQARELQMRALVPLQQRLSEISTPERGSQLP